MPLTFDCKQFESQSLVLGIIINFNDQKVTWVIDTISNKDRDTQRNSMLSSTEALIDPNLNANEPQTMRYENCQATNICDAECKHTSINFDDVIRTCEDPM
jgi:hypothetical protein